MINTRNTFIGYQIKIVMRNTMKPLPKKYLWKKIQSPSSHAHQFLSRTDSSFRDLAVPNLANIRAPRTPSTRFVQERGRVSLLMIVPVALETMSFGHAAAHIPPLAAAGILWSRATINHFGRCYCSRYKEITILVLIRIECYLDPSTPISSNFTVTHI